MSHFTVLVVTETGSGDELEKALQPYHEYECTDILDEYVVEVEDADATGGKRLTNPNAKWDCWVVGGRWTGCLVDIDGCSVDSLPLSRLAREKMEEHKVATARVTFAKLAAIADGLDLPESWATIRGRHEDDIEAARAEWRSHPLAQRLNEDRDFSWDTAEWVEILRAGEEKYVADQRDSAVAMFAMVKDGQWHERGEMGWFGKEG